LFELAHHTCLLVCEAAGSQPVSPASARLLARHQSSHHKVLESVAPATRAAYEGLTGGA
jgi:hypothetical protein